MTTTHRLERFVQAQQRDYAQALTELRAGQKRSHWIWYVLPQLRDLGRSDMARQYGLQDRMEAAEYFAHPVLGPRLLECVTAVLEHKSKSAVAIFGEVDAMKFCSCLTLFTIAVPQEPVFSTALAAFYQGEKDHETLRLLRTAGEA